nr:MAG: RNA-dependent RNA polymerase [Porcine picobirnavirus]
MKADRIYHDVETKYSDYFKLPSLSLQSTLSSIESGKPLNIRTPFYKGMSSQEIVHNWIPTLEKIAQKWPGLWEFENDLAKKVGPLSYQKPLIERIDDIDQYYTSILRGGTPLDGRSLTATWSEWTNFGGIRLRGQRNTVELMKKSTSSGSPYVTKKKHVVDQTIPCKVYYQARDTGDEVLQILSGGTYKACAILGWRGQEGGPKVSDVKQRVVWMFPFAVNIAELTCYQPLIEVAQANNIVPAWVSMDAVDAEITKLFDTKAPNDLVMCTDFTKFDQHFNSHLQSAAYDILGKLLRNEETSTSWLDYVFPIKYNIPLTYRYGRMRYGAHGMGSGSGGTNPDETLAHRALQHESAILNGQTLNPHSMCLGDDGVLSFPGITEDAVMDVYTSHGLDMNPTKQMSSTQECVYLRRWHHRDYRVDGICAGVYSTCRALGRLANQERYYDPNLWSAEMVILRSLSILENVKFHPLREEFADYCIKGDKYRLGLDIPGFFDKKKLDKLVKDSTNMMPDFLGYTKSMQKQDAGINSWWIVNYLRSKA